MRTKAFPFVLLSFQLPSYLLKMAYKGAKIANKPVILTEIHYFSYDMLPKAFTYPARFIGAIWLLLATTNTYSQHYQYFFDQFEYNQLESHLNNLDIDYHTSFKAYRESELKEFVNLDSIRDIPNYNTR